MADVTIAILTYNRPDGLRQTLTSCLSQGARLGLEIDILVIDNHPSGNGQSVVTAFEASGANIRYMPDLSRNMSALRNLGFSEAKANLVAFIDDDEVADGNWIDELVGTLRATGAAIAVGPRRALFASGSPPAYDPTGAGFTRDINLPDQADIALVNLNGKPLYGLGTGNSIFDVEKCFGNDASGIRQCRRRGCGAIYAPLSQRAKDRLGSQGHCHGNCAGKPHPHRVQDDPDPTRGPALCNHLPRRLPATPKDLCGVDPEGAYSSGNGRYAGIT
jgi:glycosyltransferase involved in cell wall biosynthesis